MARRKVRARAERCWAYVTGNVELVYNLGNMSTEGIMIGFEDIETDEPILTRESSEFYFERLIVWWRPYMLRNSLMLIPEPMSTHRIGVLNDSVDMLLGEAPNASADNFDRIFQEDVVFNVSVRPLSWDGGAVSVSTEATADFQGYPQPLKEYKWDLSTKFRLREDTSLVWQIASGPDFGAGEGHTFGCDYVLKALLRRGK